MAINNNMVRINNITGSFLDYPSPDDMCVSIYMAGCEGICKNCQNKDLQDVNNGVETELEELINNLPLFCKKYLTNKICLLGGDPLYKHNREFTKELLARTCSKYDYCVYTGYSISNVKEWGITGFKYIKCGRYTPELSRQSLKTNDYFQLASSNQEIYNARYDLLTKDGCMTFKEEYNAGITNIL